jgi:hypothetical protein
MKKEPKMKTLDFEGKTYTFKESSLKKASWIQLLRLAGVATAFAEIEDADGNTLGIERKRLLMSKTDHYRITCIK